MLGGAAEVTMAQWASAFLEKGLQLPKLAGDVWGVCFFSLMLALGRLSLIHISRVCPQHIGIPEEMAKLRALEEKLREK